MNPKPPEGMRKKWGSSHEFFRARQVENLNGRGKKSDLGSKDQPGCNYSCHSNHPEYVA
jgi:hypothetical protein